MAKLKELISGASEQNEVKLAIGRAEGFAVSPLGGPGMDSEVFKFRPTNSDETVFVSVMEDDIGSVRGKSDDYKYKGTITKPRSGGKHKTRKGKTRRGKKVSRRGKTSRR